jgi:hypothetical protein
MSANAKAFAYREHVVPDSDSQQILHRPDGRRLLAHELAHALQQRAGGTSPPAVAPETGSEAEAERPSRLVPGDGEPLERRVRESLELQQGRNFSDVRVHHGSKADEAARRLDALAFTVGRDIVFSAGAYDPSSARGRGLIAHEIAHVVQQAGAPRERRPLLGASGDPWESAAEAVVGERQVTVPAGVPPLIQRQDPRHARGYAGEQSMGFNQYRWEDGWAVVRGPSGSAGHGVTAAGEDGLMYNVRTGILRIADNKAFARAGNVSSATAIDPSRNLLQNLDDMIEAVEGIGSSADVPIRQDVLRLLRQTRAAVRNGAPLPGRVQLVVHNEYGASTGVTARLAQQGVRFIGAADPVVPPPGTARSTLGLRAQPDVPATTALGVGEPPAAALESTAAVETAAEPLLVEAPAVAAASRAGVVARAVAALAIEMIVVALISFGLSYLEQRSERELIRRRMREAEPRINAQLMGSANDIEALRAQPTRPTVWANITVRLDSSQSLAWGAGAAMILLNVGLERVAVSTDYQSGTNETSDPPLNHPTPYGLIQTRGVHTYVTYSIPLPYDPFSLDRASLERRIASNEADAGRHLPEPVFQALQEEHSALQRAWFGLTTAPP